MSRDERDTTQSADGAGAPALPARLDLVVTDGPDRGARLRLARGTIVVGSSPLCDLRLHDTTVSRRHLEVTVTDDAVLLRDLGSKNGSTYLGARFQDLRVGAGAQVTVGATALALRGDDAGAELERLATSDVSVWERDHVHALMARACGNTQKAAHIAGLDRAYVRLLKKHGAGGL